MWRLTVFSEAMEESEILPKLFILVIGEIKMMVPVIGTMNPGEEKGLEGKMNEFEMPY